MLTFTLSGSSPIAVATESRTSCGTWVGDQISQSDPRKCATELPGSIGACAMEGSWYSAATCRPEAFATSPTEYRATALSDADFFKDAKIAAEFKSRLEPSSQVTLSVRRPSIAPQTLSATMAMAESLIFPT